MGKIQRFISRARRVIFNVAPEGHSPSYEANDHWIRDPKPYERVDSYGSFEGYANGQIYQYYKFPREVETEFLQDPLDAVENQHFFTNMCKELSIMLNNSADKTHRDPRREFHIQLTQDEGTGVEPYEGITPAKSDYFRRMSQEVVRPVWHGYVGVRLIPSTMGNTEAYSFREKAKRQIEMFRNPDILNHYLFKDDSRDVTNIMLDNKFEPLDFSTDEGEDDYSNLTAWHGVEDSSYNMPRSLETTRVSVPVHGKSIKTPRWGEIAFYAVKPMDNMFMVDPKDNFARWAKALYSPKSHVVSVNIRGQIRKSEVADSIYKQQSTLRQEKRYQERQKNIKKHLTDQEREHAQINRIEEAQRASAAGHPLLDNVEIVVGIKIKPGSPSKLPAALKRYGLKAVPLLDRQEKALMSTFPCYPKPIFPTSMSNTRRSPMANQMYAGVIGMSSIFRRTKQCANRGVLLGLTDANNEFLPIMTEVEGANKHNGTPGMLITGRPGAGKTMQMQQMASQSCYDNYRVAYLNPKKTGSLAPFFENLGGIIISMSESYLQDNPGMLDPVFYIKNRDEVANLLNQNLQKALRLSEDSGYQAAKTQTQLSSEIKDSAKDPRNRTSWDIIFGNDEGTTLGISDEEYKETIRNKINSSPFWRAFIARDEFAGSEIRDKMMTGKPILVEWEKSLQIPDSAQKEKYTDEQIDSLMSVQTIFQYCVEITGEDRQGGAIFIDEAWVLKSSSQSMALVDGSLREFREANIMLVLGTQRLMDFMNPDDPMGDFTSYFSRILIMAIHSNDKREIAKFFELTGLPDTGNSYKKYRDYIVNAGVESEDVNEKTGRRERAREIPRAYYIDQLYKFEGGIICGPWPARELSFARTDKSGYVARSADDEMTQDELDGVFSPALVRAMIDDGTVDDSDDVSNSLGDDEDNIIEEYSRQNEVHDFEEQAQAAQQDEREEEDFEHDLDDAGTERYNRRNLL